MLTQMALEAICNYEMPPGQELSAVSLSWGLPEAEMNPREMETTDAWMRALLEKVCPLLIGPGSDELLNESRHVGCEVSWAYATANQRAPGVLIRFK